MEGRRTNGTTSRTDSRMERRREHCFALRYIWSRAQDDLQVDRPPRRRRPGRVAGSEPGAASPAAATDGGDDRAHYRSSATLGLGTAQAAGQTRRSLAGDETA